MSDLVLARNCCLARMLPGKAELVSEWTGLSGREKSVKRFERSNGLGTALYKTTFSFFLHWPVKEYYLYLSVVCILNVPICHRAIGKQLAGLNDIYLATGGFYGIGEAVGRSFNEERRRDDNVWHVLPCTKKVRLWNNFLTAIFPASFTVNNIIDNTYMLYH